MGMLFTSKSAPVWKPKAVAALSPTRANASVNHTWQVAPLITHLLVVFFFPATTLFFPKTALFLVRALHLVLCPLTGNPARCRRPR